MACYHPLKAFKIGVTASGKNDYKICGYNVNHIELYDDNIWRSIDTPNISKYAKRFVASFIEVPCGHCVGCRLEYSRQWANRCMLEAQYHKDNYFVTLTYDNEHLPFTDEVVSNKTGEVLKLPTLYKKDLQLFMKRLRKNYETYWQNRLGSDYNPDDFRLRYYACGEYGSRYGRPHYHLIIYNLRLDDLVEDESSSLGYKLYTSSLVEDSWNRGRVRLGEVTWESCAYTARYIMKKLNGQQAKDYYDETGIEREFVLMSRKPGIGRWYYDENKDRIFEHNQFYMSTPDGSLAIRPPRYYEKLFEVDEPEAYEVIKKKKDEFLGQCEAIKLLHTSNNYLEMLQIEENAKKRSAKKLVRKEL